MNGLHRWFVVTGLLLIVAGIIGVSANLLQAASAAARPEMVWGDPHIGVVVDTSAGMAGEIGALATVWENTDIAQIEHAVYQGVSFTDSVSITRAFAGSDEELGALVAWLQKQKDKVADDGTCPDAMLQALWAASFLGTDTFTYKRLLLASDSAPTGGRTALARTANHLAAQGVQVYPLQSGWCPNSPVLPEAIRRLSLITGGAAFRVTAGHEMTDTRMALNLMAARDDLLLADGEVALSAPDTYTFEVDGSVGAITLQLHSDRVWDCLNCLPDPQPSGVFSHENWLPLTATVRLPGGSVIGPGSSGVTFLAGSYSSQLQIESPGGVMPAGTWSLRVSGEGAYQLRVTADTSYHMRFLGPTTVPSGIEFKFRVALDGGDRTDYSARLIDTSTGEIVWADEIGDDGMHEDGAAGDGIFGGAAALPAGVYRLMVTGELAGGTTLQRMAAVPIRVRPFVLQPPPDHQVQAGAGLQHTFVLTNDGDSPQTYDLLVDSSEGWADTTVVPVSVTVDADEVVSVAIPLHVPQSAHAGVVEETSLTVVGADLLDSETVVVRTTVVGSERTYLPLVRQP